MVEDLQADSIFEVYTSGHGSVSAATRDSFNSPGVEGRDDMCDAEVDAVDAAL